jgi:hypothetical protein
MVEDYWRLISVSRRSDLSPVACLCEAGSLWPCLFDSPFSKLHEAAIDVAHLSFQILLILFPSMQ